jgi:DNA invertase Pin-like site-specific DNA recombinase
LSDGGEGNSGWKHPKESKQKMSYSRSGKSHSENHRKSLSEAQMGKKSFMYGTHLSIKWKGSIGKLSINDVNQIRKLISEKVKYKEISKKFNISQSTISMIKHNKIWNNHDLDSVSLISKSEASDNFNSESNNL